MGTFHCASCNKEIITILHKCGFKDQCNCKLYDTIENTGLVRRDETLGGGSEEEISDLDLSSLIGEDSLGSIYNFRTDYSTGVSL